MQLKHLTDMFPAFLDELEKDAGIKDDLKAGTKKVLTALRSVPSTANKAALKAAVRAQSAPVVGKAIEMARDPLNTPDIGHAIGNLAKMMGH